MVKLHRSGQKRFERHGPGRGLFEGQAFAFFVLRCVHRRDDVDQTGFQRLDNGKAVILAAQGRLDLEEVR